MGNKHLEEKINNLSEEQAKLALIGISEMYGDAVSIIVNGIGRDNDSRMDRLDGICTTNRRRLFS